jgi:hypothetical protein
MVLPRPASQGEPIPESRAPINLGAAEIRVHFSWPPRADTSAVALNFDPLDFLERKFFASAIVEFGRSRRLMIGDSFSMFQRADILQLA